MVFVHISYLFYKKIKSFSLTGGLILEVSAETFEARVTPIYLKSLRTSSTTKEKANFVYIRFAFQSLEVYDHVYQGVNTDSEINDASFRNIDTICHNQIKQRADIWSDTSRFFPET